MSRDTRLNLPPIPTIRRKNEDDTDNSSKPVSLKLGRLLGNSKDKHQHNSNSNNLGLKR